GRPDDGVESGDVFTDQLGGGPATVELLLVHAVADGGDVVEQRLEPDVDDVLVIPRNLDAPVEAGAADGEVTQALLDELDDFVAHAFRLHEVGVRLVQVEQRLLEAAHAEEVVGLLEHFDGLGVDRAHLLALELPGSRNKVAGLLVFFAADAVVALELALVDEAIVVELLQEQLHAGLVALVGGSDEVVVGDVDGLQQWLPGAVDQ